MPKTVVVLWEQEWTFFGIVAAPSFGFESCAGIEDRSCSGAPWWQLCQI